MSPLINVLIQIISGFKILEPVNLRFFSQDSYLERTINSALKGID